MSKGKLSVVGSPAAPTTGTWRDKLRRVNGRTLPSLDNLWLFIDHHDHFAGRFRRNQLTGFIEDYYQQKNITDTDVYEWIKWFGLNERITFTKEIMYAGISLAAEADAYHPIIAKFSILVWDKVERVERFAPAYLGTDDTEAYRFAGKLLLNQAIRRLYEPGCKADYMPILIGEQGIGKSTALQILGGEGYGEVYVPLDDTYYLQTAHTHWISEISELAPFKKALDARIKQVISTQRDDIHFPYARTIERRPRRFTFVGTTNEYDFSTDATGARRFIPMHCAKVNLDALARDRDQIWAEALHRYQASGEHLYNLPEAMKKLQIELYVTTPLEELLRDKLVALSWPDKITNTDVSKQLGLTHQEAMSLGSGRQVRDAMTHLGYKPMRTAKLRGYKKMDNWKEPT